MLAPAVTNHLAFLVLTWLLFVVASFGVGRRVIERLTRTASIDTLGQLAALPVGYGTLSLATYLLAAGHLLYPAVIYGFAAGALVLGARPGIHTIQQLARSVWRTLRQLLTPRQVGWLTTVAALFTLLVIGFVVLQGCKGTFLPDKSFDALWYHLTEAKLYLQEHRLLFFLPPSQLAQSTVAPRLMEFLDAFILPFSPWGDWATFAHASLLFIAIPATYRAGRQLARHPLGGVTAVLVGTVLPIIIWLMTTAYVDLATLAGSALVIGALVEQFGHDRPTDHRSPSTLVILTLAGGFLLAVKLWNLILLPSLALFFLSLPRQHRLTWRQLGWLFGGMLLIAGPFYLEALLRTGNPIYPVLVPSFADTDHLRGAHSIGEYLRVVLPHTTLRTWNDLMVGESLLWVGLVLTAAGLLGGWVERRVLPFVAFAVSLFVLWSIIPVADMRYALVAVPALAVVGSVGIAAVVRQPSLLALITCVVLVSGSVNLAQAIRVEEHQYLGHAITNEQRTAFLTEFGHGQLVAFDSAGVLPGLTNHEKILLLDHNMFYIDVPFTDGLGIVANGVPANSSADLLNRLIDRGYHFLLVKTNMYGVKDLFIGVDQPDSSWIDSHFQPIWRDGAANLTLYALSR